MKIDKASVFSIDPGGTTGWCLIADAEPRLLPHGDCDLELLADEVAGDEHQQVLDLVKLITWSRNKYGNCAVVIEDFIPRMLNKERYFLSPVRVTAGLTQLLWQDRIRWCLQQASLAKSTISDDYLKATGHWMPGKGHAMDAARHGMTYLRRIRKIPELHEQMLELRDLDDGVVT